MSVDYRNSEGYPDPTPYEAFRRIEEDIDDLFYYDNNIRNDSICRFENGWREGGEEDAHGA